MKPWLFIADLHLSPQRPDIIALFQRFCEDIASNAERLYILGDFVEYWIGDDNDASGLQPAFDALAQLSQQGVKLFFMAGNRDFLVGDRLAQRCGFSRLADPAVIHFGAAPILLMHGDSLCTDDAEYQQFRLMVRDPQWQQQFLAKPLAEREAMARAMREHSMQANTEKDEFIMDVNQHAVEQAMQQHGVDFLIHGHTHRPAVHAFETGGRRKQRIVLPDWYDHGGYLALTDLQQLSLQTIHP